MSIVVEPLFNILIKYLAASEDFHLGCPIRKIVLVYAAYL